MRNVLTGLLFLVLLWAATTNFSGCSRSKTGQPAAKGALANEPDVTFKDLQGKNVPLASLKGKVVLVDFWATWCEPCRTEIPWLIEFQQKYADKGFTMLGVAMDITGRIRPTSTSSIPAARSAETDALPGTTKCSGTARSSSHPARRPAR